MGCKWILLKIIKVVYRLVDVFSQSLSLSLFYGISIQVTLSIGCMFWTLFKKSRRFPLIKEWKEKKEEESGTLFIFQTKIDTLHHNHLEVLLDHTLLGPHQSFWFSRFWWGQILWISNKFSGNADMLFWRSHFENHCNRISWKISGNFQEDEMVQMSNIIEYSEIISIENWQLGFLS